jgi:hypothetical protein
MGKHLNCYFDPLAGPDSDDIFKLLDEDLTVADLAGFCLFLDNGDNFFRDTVRHHHFDLHFRNKRDIELRLVIQVDVSHLPAESPRFRDYCQSAHT